MRKILLLSLLFILAFAACQKKGPQYEINGTITGDLNGKTVYLKKIEKMRQGAIIDSTVIADNTFMLKGDADTLEVYSLVIDGIKSPVTLFIDTPVEVLIDKDNPANIVVKNSKFNDLYAVYNKQLKALQAGIQDISKRAKEAEDKGEATPEFDAQLEEEYEQVMDAIKKYQLNFIDNHLNSTVSAYILRSMRNLSADEIDEYAGKFNDAYSKSYFITSAKEVAQIMRNTEIGQKFTDVKLADAEGKPIALSDYVGKGNFVLVEFWASWCPYCRKENPNIVGLYDKYKGKGLEVVGISLDRSRDKWVEAIKADGITWPQMSDLKQWLSEGAYLYNIRSIPSSVLLDKEGIIIAKNLHGEELRNKIEELIDNK